MARLIGVKNRGEGFIEYNGEYYEAQHVDAQAIAGDIVRHDHGFSYIPAGTYDILDHDLEYADGDGDYWSYDNDNDTLFRKVPSISESLATKRTQLATLTAEIAELEAQLTEESRLRVGDYARVIDGPEGGRFEEGSIMLVTEVAKAQSAIYPIGAVSPLLGYVAFEAFKPEDLVKITPEEARASLIAKIDAHFGGQEAK